MAVTMGLGAIGLGLLTACNSGPQLEAVTVAPTWPSETTATTVANGPSQSGAASTPPSGSSGTGAPDEGSTSTTALAVQIGSYERPVIDPDNPAVVARPVPGSSESEPNTTTAPSPWADQTDELGGRVAIDVGCAESNLAPHLDNFFAEQVGPVLGWDYQHVYPLGGDRWLWTFQDTFIDYADTASTLGQARFVHNTALVQEGSCFTLLYGGTPARPAPFEPGNGTTTLQRWFWPMGGDLMSNGELGIFWVEMVKDDYDPSPPDGLGWHPNQTFLARYNPDTLERTAFGPAPNSGVSPIYGYSVASDDTHTYLFANTFEQNLSREGGYWNGPHSAAKVWLARVPKGQLDAQPEYRTVLEWSTDPGQAEPISDRFWAENPFQVRYLDGQWVAVSAVDGYWGDDLSVDVAYDPWGPWLTTAYQPLSPRGGDPKMNTYHVYLLPWRGNDNAVQLSVSNNARDMLTDAWPNPERYRPNLFSFPYTETPPTTPVPVPETPPPLPTPTLGSVPPVSTSVPSEEG